MNKEATSLFLSPSPGSFYFKSTSLWLICKMLFSSCIFLLKNHSGSPGKYEQLGQHSASCAQSLPSSTLTCNFHSSQGSLLASLLPGSMSFSILHTFLEHPLTPSFQWFCLSFNALKSSMAYFNEVICLPVHIVAPLWWAPLIPHHDSKSQHGCLKEYGTRSNPSSLAV